MLDVIDVELPALRGARRPHPGPEDGPRPPIHLLHLQLRRDVPGAVAAVRRDVRDRRRRGAGPGRERRRHGRDRPRPGLGAAGRRRARLAADPRRRRRLPAHQGSSDAGAGGPSAGTQRRPRGLVDRRYARAGYGWCFPADGERRIGACSYWPDDHVREGTDILSADLGTDQVRYQGNWIPHRLRPPTEAGVFFVGDSAGQCLPLTAEGIRTALLRDRRRP